MYLSSPLISLRTLQVEQAVHHLQASLQARKQASQWLAAVQHAHASLALSGKHPDF